MIQKFIFTAGALTLILGIFHTTFYRFMKWENDLKKVSEFNRNVLYTIHIALTLLIFLLAVITLLYYKELSLNKGIAFTLNIGLFLFWLWRTIYQIVYYSGKAIHYTLVIVFLFLTISYSLPVINSLICVSLCNL